MNRGYDIGARAQPLRGIRRRVLHEGVLRARRFEYQRGMTSANSQRFGVIGAGQMGRGIAQVAAGSGFSVVLCDATKALAESGKSTIGASLAKLVDKGKMSADDRSALLDRISASDGLAGLAEVDIAVEAATENVEIKLGLFREADRLMPKDAILASNTSSISITRLAGATSRPTRVIGMHFMNPVPLMKLVEIVRGVQTSDATYDEVKALSIQLGKTVITSKDAPGFLVNRMLIPFLNEACFALEQGLGTPEDIDAGARLGLNHPMGPLELADLIGLDTTLFIAEVLQREFGDPKYRPATILKNLVAAGWYGKKSGRGFYVYDDKGQKTGRSL
jgi:3-hydroxybutyryl-CoA dehydrogenase